jgi:ABC-2 type transport system ATP-binding protein
MRAGPQLAYLARLHGLGPREAAEASGRCLERLGLADRAGDRVERLSLGNQQRVQLAAALVHDPELLILDEPFAGLDPVGVDTLSEVLRGYARRGVPVVFSSHQLELVERLCDAVAIIDDGRLVATGPVPELRSRGRDTRLRVDGPRGSDWPRHLRGVDVAECTDEGVVLRLDEHADSQEVLDAARRCGPVTHFGFVEPTLAELYRQVVGGGERPTGAPAEPERQVGP